jgi:tetratricopeptide (TPR) repeat protein
MKPIFPLLILSMGIFLSACAGNTFVDTKPVQPPIIPHTTLPSDDKQTKEDADSLTDPQKLYDQKQYDQALMAMLELDPRCLEDLSARKLLWRINDRLVTAQWYLQQSIAELLKGHQDKARYHLDQVLKLYPDHKPSRLLAQKLNAITLKEPPKPPKTQKPLKKKQAIPKDPAKEDLNLADYYLTAGSTYFEEGRLPLAKASWLRGLDIVPSHTIIQKKLVALLTNEGLQLFGQGFIQASIEKWEEALKINPDAPETKGYLDKARKAEAKVRSIE